MRHGLTDTQSAVAAGVIAVVSREPADAPERSPASFRLTAHRELVLRALANVHA
jgi:hypothetical protein